MEELGAKADDCATNQVLYNPEARGIESTCFPGVRSAKCR
jgi:hypothetical protein